MLYTFFDLEKKTGFEINEKKKTREYQQDLIKWMLGISKKHSFLLLLLLYSAIARKICAILMRMRRNYFLPPLSVSVSLFFFSASFSDESWSGHEKEKMCQASRKKNDEIVDQIITHRSARARSRRERERELEERKIARLPFIIIIIHPIRSSHAWITWRENDLYLSKSNQ